MYFTCKHTPARVRRFPIPKGYAGTRATTRYIIDLIKSGARDFCVRQHAVGILRTYGVAPKDFLGEIAALFDWVRRRVRYTRDIFGTEVLHSAQRMLDVRAGDCDDMTILLGAMLEAVGHPVRLVIVGRNPRRRDLFSHIYLEVYHHGRWIALDPTMRRPMGWAPKGVRRQVISLRRRPYVQTR